MKRALGILVAVGLIALAVEVRSVLHTHRARARSAAHQRARAGLPKVACSTDLQLLCDQLAAAGTIADATPTLEPAAAADPAQAAKVDGWITWAPTPDLADISLQASSDTPWTTAATALRASAGASITTAGAAALATGGCSSTAISLRCIEPLAGSGAVSVGVGDPASAEGIVRFGLLAGPTVEAQLNGPDGIVSHDPLERIAVGQGSGSSASAGQQVVAQDRPGLGQDVVIGPLAVLRANAATAQARAQHLQVATIPGATLTIVLAERGRSLPAVADALAGSATAKARRRLGLAKATAHADPTGGGTLFQIQKALR